MLLSSLKSRAPNFQQVPSSRWVALLFVGVLLVTTAGVVRESFGIADVIGTFFSGAGRLVGPAGPNQLLQFEEGGGEYKSLFTSENYHRCQNKLGATLLTVSPNTALNRNTLNSRLEQYYLQGMRHAVINVSDLTNLSSDSQFIEDMKYALEQARNNFIVPIISINNVSGGNEIQKMNSFFTLISVNSNPFIAVTAPQSMVNSGDVTKVIETSEFVATYLQDSANKLNNVLVASPNFKLSLNKASDMIEIYVNAGFHNRNRDNGKPIYDILLVTAENSDSDFANLTASGKGGQGVYEKTAHWLFADPEGGERFTARQFMNDRNREDVILANNSDGTQVFSRPQMQAIIFGFGPAPNSVPAGVNESFLQRIENDFGYFSDDPLVRAVIVSPSLNDMLSGSLGDNGRSEYYSRLTLAGTNCNYDTSNPEVEYAERSVAASCAVREDPGNGNKKVSSRVVCMREDSGDYHCEATINHTVQVGLPIRHFGSNSVYGTDTRSYATYTARALNSTTSAAYDPLNQFAGTLKIGNLTYSMPWLGSAINNTSQLMRFLTFDRPVDPANYSLFVNSEQELGQEVNRQDRPDYDSRSLFVYGPDNPNPSLQFPALDEKTTYFGSTLGLDKKSPILPNIRVADFKQVTHSTKTVNQCGGDVRIVANDPQNMVYGSEMVLRQDKWSGTGAEMCYDLALPGGQLDGSASCINTQKSASIQCTCDDWNKTLYGSFPPALTIGNVSSNVACRASKQKINNCISYTGGANTYASSLVTLNKEQPKPAQVDVEGVYDALAEAYTQLQDILSYSGRKAIFSEPRGWETESVVRSYVEVPFYEGGFRITEGRQNLMLEPGQSIKGKGIPDAGGGTGGSLVDAQCAIGVSGGSTDTKGLSYGLAQIIVTGSENPDDVASRASELCAQGVIPQIRSCYLGNCAFDAAGPAGGGAAQAEFINRITGSANWTCGSAVVTCGHNEPNAEYNPTPARTYSIGDTTVEVLGGVEEGRFTAACTSAINKRDGSIAVTTPIFNGTHPDKAENMANFFAGYNSAGGSLDVFDCYAANIYEEPGLDGSINRFTNEVLASAEAAGLGDLPLCIMETGIVGGTNSGEQNADVISQWLSNFSDRLAFVLGFNWHAGASNNWAHFELDDLGAATLQRGCPIIGSGAGLNITPSTPDNDDDADDQNASLTGKMLEGYDQHMAEGDSWNKYYNYYEALAYLDEISKLLAIYATIDGASTTRFISENDSGYLKSGPAEHFVSMFTCDEWEREPELIEALAKAREKYGEDFTPNCITYFSTSTAAEGYRPDPLAELLCDKGYNVGPECKISCEVEQTVTNPDYNPGNSICHPGTACEDELSKGKNGIGYPVCRDAIRVAGTDTFCGSLQQVNRDYGTGDDSIFETRAPIPQRLRMAENAGEANSTTIRAFGTFQKVNNKIIPILRKVEAEIEQWRDGDSYNFPSGKFKFVSAGGFNRRAEKCSLDTKIGLGCLSMHSYGLAMDFNVDTNPFYASTGKCSVDIPPEFVDAMERNGFRWGGRFGTNRFDPMHFEYNPYCLSGQLATDPQDLPKGGTVSGQNYVCTPAGGGGGPTTTQPPGRCNEFNYAPGDPQYGSFETSLQAISSWKYFKELPTDRWLDRYGPYCDNETLGLPFASNFFEEIYDLILSPGTPGGRLCADEPIPRGPLTAEDDGRKCDRATEGLGNRHENPKYEDYRGAIKNCPIPSAQMGWTEENSLGLSPAALADHLMSTVTYNGVSLSNTPRDKVIRLLEVAQQKDINPIVLLGIWGTESAFGQFRPECNVY